MIDLLYFKKYPEWQSYDCDNLQEVTQEYLELKKFLISYFENQMQMKSTEYATEQPMVQQQGI